MSDVRVNGQAFGVQDLSWTFLIKKLEHREIFVLSIL